MTTASVNPDHVQRIVNNQHHNPFEVLGSHRVDGNGHPKWAIRAYLPDADAVWVVRPQEQREYPMQSVHHPHFFTCELEAEECKNYQLRVKRGDREHTFYDPYAFKSPLLTEFDTYLFSEGNHHRIYEKMGAHPVEVDGIAGTYFAVWAPNARNVSVLGNFNGWDGRHHQMRNSWRHLGSVHSRAGHWRTVQVRGQGPARGHPHQVRPLRIPAGGPPHTASIVA
jgi:1,4-alpha-glucan branching enzyme